MYTYMHNACTMQRQNDYSTNSLHVKLLVFLNSQTVFSLISFYNSTATPLHLVMFRSCNSHHIELFHHVIVLPPLCRCRVQEGREAQMASTMWALQEGREGGREGRRKEGRDEE